MLIGIMLIGLSVRKNDWKNYGIYFLNSNLVEYRIGSEVVEEYNDKYESIEEWKLSSQNYYFIDIFYNGEIPHTRKEAEDLIISLVPEIEL